MFKTKYLILILAAIITAAASIVGAIIQKDSKGSEVNASTNTGEKEVYIGSKVMNVKDSNIGKIELK